MVPEKNFLMVLKAEYYQKTKRKISPLKWCEKVLNEIKN